MRKPFLIEPEETCLFDDSSWKLSILK